VWIDEDALARIAKVIGAACARSRGASKLLTAVRHRRTTVRHRGGIETMNRRIVFALHVLVSALSLSPVCVAASTSVARGAPVARAAQSTPYVRAKSSGAALYNLPDRGAAVITNIPAATLLAVHSERAGYMEVEPAGGFEVWVFGQYAKPTDMPGVFELTGNNVLMRPRASSDESSYPLGQKLNKGDRVRLVGRADTSKPIVQDWLRITAPPGTRAWVLMSDTTPLAANEDARALWAAAVKTAQASTKPFDPALLGAGAATAAAATTAAPGAASGAAGTSQAAAQTALAEAEKRMVEARAAAKPDFSAAKAAYERVLEESPKGAAADTARLRLEEIAARQEIVRIRADAQATEGARQAELAKADARLREASVSQDPMWGRFQARGWLEREKRPGQPARFVVRWGGKTVSEIVCTSGRYDLAAFDGYEVGLMGVTLRGAAAQADGSSDPMRIDAARIEVISGRYADR
jgi:hypothetical protein